MKTQAILIAAVALLLGTEATQRAPAIPGKNTTKILKNFDKCFLYMNNGHTGSLLGDFNNLQLYLNSNALNV
jgi:hypothetical protein